MKLWNIIPAISIPTRNPPREVVEDYVKYVATFLNQCILINEIDDFFINRLGDEALKSGLEFTVGKKVGISNVQSIARAAILSGCGISVRSRSCRFFSFGMDYDAWICMKHVDVLPSVPKELKVSDISEYLIITDWYDD
jgi:hypothetical protein